MKLMNVQELSERLNLPTSTIKDKRWRARMGLPAVKLGERVLFREQDVERVITKHLERLPVSG